MAKNTKMKQSSEQGVPRETPLRNCFPKLYETLAPAIGEAATRRLIAALKNDGYFKIGLLDQSRLIVKKIVELGDGKILSETLITSESDKIRSIGIHVHFEHFKHDLKSELRFLNRTGALPGTWTQETAQWVLKNVVHEHGLERVLPRVNFWVNDRDPAVRRMLAEALRPRGVWCKHIISLKQDPTPIKALLESLLDDESDYVRKAVANNLNDISKDNADQLCDWIANWQRGEISAERRWIIQRALRSLIKSNHPHAMKLLGLGDTEAVELTWRKGTVKEIQIGQSILFEIDCHNNGKTSQQLRLQLLMIGPGKNDKTRIAKYLLGGVRLAPHSSAGIVKKVKFAHKNFVPKLPGTYRLQVHCNGRLIGERMMEYLGKDL